MTGPLTDVKNFNMSSPMDFGTPVLLIIQLVFGLFMLYVPTF